MAATMGSGPTRASSSPWVRRAFTIGVDVEKQNNNNNSNNLTSVSGKSRWHRRRRRAVATAAAAGAGAEAGGSGDDISGGRSSLRGEPRDVREFIDVAVMASPVRSRLLVSTLEYSVETTVTQWMTEREGGGPGRPVSGEAFRRWLHERLGRNLYVGDTTTTTTLK